MDTIVAGLAPTVKQATAIAVSLARAEERYFAANRTAERLQTATNVLSAELVTAGVAEQEARNQSKAAQTRVDASEAASVASTASTSGRDAAAAASTAAAEQRANAAEARAKFAEGRLEQADQIVAAATAAKEKACDAAMAVKKETATTKLGVQFLKKSTQADGSGGVREYRGSHDFLSPIILSRLCFSLFSFHLLHSCYNRGDWGCCGQR